MTNHMTLQEWVKYGFDMGYAEGFCMMHDTPPLTEEEAEEWFVEGGDPCIPTIRVWVDQEPTLATVHHIGQHNPSE